MKMEKNIVNIELSTNVAHDINVASVGVLYAHGLKVNAIGEILELPNEVVENIIRIHNFVKIFELKEEESE